MRAHFRLHKARIFREINNNGYKTSFKAFLYEHLMKCFKLPWDISFTKDLNMFRWRIEGMSSFSRHALWRKVDECRFLDSFFSFFISTSPGSLPPR